MTDQNVPEWESDEFAPVFAQIQQLLANERWGVITADDAITQETRRAEITKKIAILIRTQIEKAREEGSVPSFRGAGRRTAGLQEFYARSIAGEKVRYETLHGAILSPALHAAEIEKAEARGAERAVEYIRRNWTTQGDETTWPKFVALLEAAKKNITTDV